VGGRFVSQGERGKEGEKKESRERERQSRNRDRQSKESGLKAAGAAGIDKTRQRRVGAERSKRAAHPALSSFHQDYVATPLANRSNGCQLEELSLWL
jgi:hypothetical protein